MEAVVTLIQPRLNWNMLEAVGLTKTAGNSLELPSTWTIFKRGMGSSAWHVRNRVWGTRLWHDTMWSVPHPLYNDHNNIL